MEAASLLTTLGFRVDGQSAAAFEKVQHHIESIKSRLEILAGAEIIRGLYELTERFGNMGEQLESASVAAGLTTESYQALSYAAAQNGVSQEEMATGLARLSRSLYQAKQGSKEAVETFTNLGISQEQLAGFHTSEDAFLAIGDALKSIPDATTKVALLQEAMGRGSFKLLKFAQQGRGEIHRLKTEAGEIGAVLGGNYIEDLAKSEDAVSGFKQVVSALVAELGARFAPNVIAVTHALEKFWMRNRDIIMSKLDDWFYDLGFALGSTYAAFEIVGGAVASFIRNNQKLAAPLGTLIKYFLGVSAAMGGIEFAWHRVKQAFGVGQAVFSLAITPLKFFVSIIAKSQGLLVGMARIIAMLTETSFPALSAALVRFAVGLEATPIGLVAAAVVALGAAAYTAYEMWNGKDFKNTKLGVFLSWTKDILSEIAQAIDNLTNNNLSRFLGATYSRLKPRNNDILAPIREDQDLARVGHALSSGYNAVANFVRPGALTNEIVATTPAAASMPQAGQVAMVNNTPVTINVNGAQQPQAVAQQIAEALASHQDSVNRSNMAALRTALVH